jgi:hypothetical protein
MTRILEKLVNAMATKQFTTQYYKDTIKKECIPFYNHLLNINQKNKLSNTFAYVNNEKYKSNEFYCSFVLIEDNSIMSFHGNSINDVVKQILVANSDELKEQDEKYDIAKNENNIPISKKQIKNCLNNSYKIYEETYTETFTIETSTYTIKMKPEIILFDGVDSYQDSTILIFYDNDLIYDVCKYKPHFTVIYKMQIIKDNRKVFDDNELIALFDGGVINKNNNCNIKISSKNKKVVITNNINCNITVNSDNSINNSDNDNSDSDNLFTDNFDNISVEHLNIEDSESNDFNDDRINDTVYKPVSFKVPSPHKNTIIELLNELQTNNIKFIQLLDNYTNINIIKGLHYDNIKNLHSYHFTGYLYNNKTKIRSNTLHFYIINNSIYSITEINNLI